MYIQYGDSNDIMKAFLRDFHFFIAGFKRLNILHEYIFVCN